MNKKQHRDPDREERNRTLAVLLAGANFDARQSARLDTHFVRLHAAKHLLQMSTRPLLKDLRSELEELEQISVALARRLQFDAFGKKGVYSPVLLELLSDAFDHQNLPHMQAVLQANGDDWPYQVGESEHWHAGQWGVWSRRLSADLYLLKQLSVAVQHKLSTGGADIQASPAMTREALVLEIHHALSQCLLEGKRPKNLAELIADVMLTYDLDIDITTEAIRGVLRKYKLGGRVKVKQC